MGAMKHKLNIKLELTEILEISFFGLYLLIHAIKNVVKITEYSIKEFPQITKQFDDSLMKATKILAIWLV